MLQKIIQCFKNTLFCTYYIKCPNKSYQSAQFWHSQRWNEITKISPRTKILHDDERYTIIDICIDRQRIASNEATKRVTSWIPPPVFITENARVVDSTSLSQSSSIKRGHDNPDRASVSPRYRPLICMHDQRGNSQRPSECLDFPFDGGCQLFSTSHLAIAWIDFTLFPPPPPSHSSRDCSLSKFGSPFHLNGPLRVG